MDVYTLHRGRVHNWWLSQCRELHINNAELVKEGTQRDYDIVKKIRCTRERSKFGYNNDLVFP